MEIERQFVAFPLPNGALPDGICEACAAASASFHKPTGTAVLHCSHSQTGALLDTIKATSPGGDQWKILPGILKETLIWLVANRVVAQELRDADEPRH